MVYAQLNNRIFSFSCPGYRFDWMKKNPMAIQIVPTMADEAAAWFVR